jgi:hypothetical protein
MTDRKLMQQALDFLVGGNFAYPTKLATALRERLAQPEREWQGLTENEMKNLADTHLVYQVETPEMSGVFDLIRAVAKKLEEKNT